MDESDDWVVVKEEDLPSNSYDFEVIEYEQVRDTGITNDLFAVATTPLKDYDHDYEENQLAVVNESSSWELTSEDVNALMSSTSSPPISFGQEEDRMPSYESCNGETPILNQYPKNGCIENTQVSRIVYKYKKDNRIGSSSELLRAFLDTIATTEDETHLQSVPAASDFPCVGGEATVSLNDDFVGAQRVASLQKNICSPKSKKNNTSLKR